GLSAAPEPHYTAPLAHDVSGNGPRAHYMRGRIENGTLQVFDKQDSALLTVLADANALVLRPPNDSPRKAGDTLSFVHL
ncbi:MAG: molybdopterin molybdenumtransferase MoeA, partial [Pseudomonadota bacterium]